MQPVLNIKKIRTSKGQFHPIKESDGGHHRYDDANPNPGKIQKNGR